MLVNYIIFFCIYIFTTFLLTFDQVYASCHSMTPFYLINVLLKFIDYLFLIVKNYNLVFYDVSADNFNYLSSVFVLFIFYSFVRSKPLFSFKLVHFFKHLKLSSTLLGSFILFQVNKKKSHPFKSEEQFEEFKKSADLVLRKSMYRNDNRLLINMQRFKYLDYNPRQRTPKILIPYLEMLEPSYKRVWGNWKKYPPTDPRFWNQSGHPTQPDLGLDPCLDIWGVSPEKGTPITKQMLESYNPNYWGDMMKFKAQHGISWHKFKYNSRVDFYTAFPKQHPHFRTLSAGWEINAYDHARANEFLARVNPFQAYRKAWKEKHSYGYFKRESKYHRAKRLYKTRNRHPWEDPWVFERWMFRRGITTHTKHLDDYFLLTPYERGEAFDQQLYYWYLGATLKFTDYRTAWWSFWEDAMYLEEIEDLRRYRLYLKGTPDLSDWKVHEDARDGIHYYAVWLYYHFEHDLQDLTRFRGIRQHIWSENLKAKKSTLRQLRKWYKENNYTPADLHTFLNIGSTEKNIRMYTLGVFDREAKYHHTIFAEQRKCQAALDSWQIGYKSWYPYLRQGKTRILKALDDSWNYKPFEREVKKDLWDLLFLDQIFYPDFKQKDVDKAYYQLPRYYHIDNSKLTNLVIPLNDWKKWELKPYTSGGGISPYLEYYFWLYFNKSSVFIETVIWPYVDSFIGYLYYIKKEEKPDYLDEILVLIKKYKPDYIYHPFGPNLYDFYDFLVLFLLIFPIICIIIHRILKKIKKLQWYKYWKKRLNIKRNIMFILYLFLVFCKKIIKFFSSSNKFFFFKFLSKKSKKKLFLIFFKYLKKKIKILLLFIYIILFKILFNILKRIYIQTRNLIKDLIFVTFVKIMVIPCRTYENFKISSILDTINRWIHNFLILIQICQKIWTLRSYAFTFSFFYLLIFYNYGFCLQAATLLITIDNYSEWLWSAYLSSSVHKDYFIINVYEPLVKYDSTDLINGFFMSRGILYFFLCIYLWNTQVAYYLFSDGWGDKIWKNNIALFGLRKPHMIFEAKQLPWWIGRNKTTHAKIFRFFFMEQYNQPVVPVQFLSIISMYSTVFWFVGTGYWHMDDDWIGWLEPDWTWSVPGILDSELEPWVDNNIIRIYVVWGDWVPPGWMYKNYAFCYDTFVENFNYRPWYKFGWVALFLLLFPKYRMMAYGRAFMWPVFIWHYHSWFQNDEYHYIYFILLGILLVSNIEKWVYMKLTKSENPEAEWLSLQRSRLFGPTGWEEREATKTWIKGDPGYYNTIWEDLHLTWLVPQKWQDNAYHIPHGLDNDPEIALAAEEEDYVNPYIWLRDHRQSLGDWTEFEEKMYLALHPHKYKPQYWYVQDRGDAHIKYV